MENIDVSNNLGNPFPLLNLLNQLKLINNNDNSTNTDTINKDIKALLIKIGFLVDNYDIILDSENKKLYAALCILQMPKKIIKKLKQNTKQSNEKRPRNSQDDDDDDDDDVDSDLTNDTQNQTNKRIRLNHDLKIDSTSSVENEELDKNKNGSIPKDDLELVESSSESEDDIDSTQISDENMEIIKNEKREKKRQEDEMVQNFQNSISANTFKDVCYQIPFTDHALFPALPEKSTDNELSLFSRLDSLDSEKQPDFINNLLQLNSSEKIYIQKCWDNYCKNRKINNKKDLEIRSDDNEDDIEDEEEDTDDENNKNQEVFDYIPNKIYRSRLWDDSLLYNYNILNEEKMINRRRKEEYMGMYKEQKRIQVCSECLNRFKTQLRYIPCSGEHPCERCKRLGIICYYPYWKTPKQSQDLGNLYQLKENNNHPLTFEDFENHSSSMFEEGSIDEDNIFVLRNKLKNDAIIYSTSDNLIYNYNSKIHSWVKAKKNLNNQDKKVLEEMAKCQNEKEKQAKKNKNMLGKTFKEIPTSELLDSIHYSISKKIKTDGLDELMNYKYDVSALIATGILMEELIKEMVEKEYNRLNE